MRKRLILGFLIGVICSLILASVSGLLEGKVVLFLISPILALSRATGRSAVVEWIGTPIYFGLIGLVFSAVMTLPRRKMLWTAIILLFLLLLAHIYFFQRISFYPIK